MAARRRKNVHSVDTRSLHEAAALLRRGELVAFPTETVYGLGANALDAKAVAKIFEAKGRPQDNPVIVHVSDLRMLRKVADPPPPRARALIARFWPGPLTLLLSKKSSLPSSVTAGLDTVAVRMPGRRQGLGAVRDVRQHVQQRDVDAQPSQGAGHRETEAPGPTGDHSDLTVEILKHARGPLEVEMECYML